MIPTPQPDELDAAVVAVDQALDALARGRAPMTDPALAALADFAHAIEARATALEAERPAGHATTGNDAGRAGLNGKTIRPVAATPMTGPLGRRHPRARPVRATRLRRIMPAIAAAVVVVLVGSLPFNGSTSSPLYPQYQLLFQHSQPAAADNVRLNLVNAREALDDATANSTATPSVLDRARRLLAQARGQLAQVTDPDTRSELEQELSELEQRADRMSGDQHGEGAGPGHDGQGEGAQGSTADPTDDPQDESGHPASSPDGGQQRG